MEQPMDSEDGDKNNDINYFTCKGENFQLVERAHRLGCLVSLLMKFKRNASLIRDNKQEQSQLEHLCDLMAEFSYHNIECPYETENK